MGRLPSGCGSAHIVEVSESTVYDFPLPDQKARQRILADLDTNLLVEAGAGSGKTTALVGRMVALIERGTARVDEIAAVTFTRKSAAELRERFQTRVEERLREARSEPETDPLVIDRLTRALDEIDRAFVGTIHSFCGRLLRERPLDLGLDPGFEELPVEERDGLRRQFWEAYLERLARDSDPILEELSRAGLAPAALRGLFDRIVENPDVDFPVSDTAPPTTADVGAIRDALDSIVSTAWELMDDTPPEKGWDSLQKKLRKLHFEREITGWREAPDLFEAIATLCKTGREHSTTYNRWKVKELTKSLLEEINAFGHGATQAHALVDRWYAHRYALAIRLVRAAATAFEEHRLRIARLDFQDLLGLAARLLRENRDVRRQLGLRYRRLLVDEFQDTDPLQAEIMLLLSSDPDGGSPDPDGAPSDPDGADAMNGAAPVDDWRWVEPRPGALFVVGDPKQSIYRFRRADIQLYGRVRARFESFGDVLSLSTNFRSRPAIGDVVNDVFDAEDFFPAEANEEQAGFERLDTRPPTEPVPEEGVFTYELDPIRNNKADAARDDAARIASWIRRRVDEGRREPGDFLILTRQRAHLDAYARELEARDLPVQVTGAGVGVEEEMHELVVLLRCMIDPSNPVRTVAALVGLFFGLDYERLVEHRLAGGDFDAMRPGDRGHPDVRAALATLHRWWLAATSDPADVFVGRLVADVGLLPFAASGELGTLRSGALLYALDAIRAAAYGGDTSLPGAVRALESALDLKEAEAPLEPGRADAIRLMNLHQAKGLEGRVVILANPSDVRVRTPEDHMRRGADGSACGYMRVTEALGSFKGSRDLARPLGWAEYESVERRFVAAEEVRLLYVAVTRAMEELVVARWPAGKGTSPWAPLDRSLDEHATPLEMPIDDPPEREELDVSPGAVADALEEASARIRVARDPSYRRATVTELAKGFDADVGPGGREGRRRSASRRGAGRGGDADFRGFAWGSAVHGALAIAATELSETALRAACRDLLVQNQRPLDDHGEPVELRELLDLVRDVGASSLWQRALASDRRLVEVTLAAEGVELRAQAEGDDGPEPGSAPEPGDGRPQLDMFAPSIQDVGDIEPVEPEQDDASGAGVLLEGVVDLAFRERGGWVIADYKTDIGTDPDFPAREAAYRRQVELYAEAWKKLTGEPIKERVLFFTTQGRVESW